MRLRKEIIKNCKKKNIDAKGLKFLIAMLYISLTTMWVALITNEKEGWVIATTIVCIVIPIAAFVITETEGKTKKEK